MTVTSLRRSFTLPSIGVLLLLGLALRLLIAYVLLPNEGLGSDLRLFDKWAITLADHGPGGFYANAGFADYTPGYLWVLWPMGAFAEFFGRATNQDPLSVMAAIVKVPGILADLAVGYLLYRAVRRWSGEFAGRISAALFLFIPISWYLSALWGQVDVVGSLVILAAVLLLIEGWSEAAVGAAVLATVIKPQYGLVDVVVGVILLRRHLLRQGSGPVPVPGARIAALNHRLGGLFTARQGPIRLVTSAVVGVVVSLAVVLPFDLPYLATGSIAKVPIAGHVAGILAIAGNAATYYNVLTANAYNFWALVGPTPLSHALSNTYQWTYDSLPVLFGLSAVTVGILLLGAAIFIAVVQLLRRDDRTSIVLTTTVLAVAFFALPTRVHERYLFPAFVLGALLAATSVRWRWWYVLLAAANFVNLHAILTQPYEGYGTLTVQRLLYGRLFRTDPFVIAAALAHTALFLWALWQLRPALDPVVRRAALIAAALRGTQARPADAGSKPDEVPRPDESPTVDEFPTPPPGPAPTAAPTPGWRPTALAENRVVAAIRARLDRPPIWRDRSAELAREQTGRFGRRDLAIAAGLFVVTMVVRTVNLGQPQTMYFDEDYHARTAMEFLQGWRYDVPHDIYEWTHPHLAKYVIAGGLTVFGDNRVVGGGNVGASVYDAAREPRYAGLPNESTSGQLLFVATGDSVLAIGLADSTHQAVLHAPGAISVASDPTTPLLYVGTSSGQVFAVDEVPLELATQPTSHLVATLAGPVQHIWPTAPGTLAVQVGSDELDTVDTANGTIGTPVTLGAITDAVAVPMNQRPALAVTTSAGAFVLDGHSLVPIAQLPGVASATGIEYVDGNDYLRRARDLLPLPVLYVANGTTSLASFELEANDTFQAFPIAVLPGPVTDLRWNRTTNLLHLLGRTASGQQTVYVMDPHGNAVFADAALPFPAAAWVLDVNPADSGADRERALVLSANGDLASIDIGSNAFAWRFPGVLAGALMSVLLYALARLLFRRRSVAVLAGLATLLDGLLYAQSRIAMNDTDVGLFIVAAYALLAWLLLRTWDRRGTWAAVVVGLPVLGVLLGLALASKWVGAYAIGGAVLLVLVQSALGRLLALVGLVGLTGGLGFLALTDHPPNVTFFAIMVVITVVTAAMFVKRPLPFRPGEVRFAVWGPIGLGLGACVLLLLLAVAGISRAGLASVRVGPVGLQAIVVLVGALCLLGLGAAVLFEGLRRLGAAPALNASDRGRQSLPRRPDWTQPAFGWGLPFTWALICLTLLPLGVYVLSYVPWALTTAGGPQLFAGWPPGHTGQTFLDLQAAMYQYHNELRAPHGASSPWWAWPLDLKPIWGYLDSAAGNTEETVFATGNLVLFWLGIPAAAFGAWQAWRRRSWALGFVTVALLCQWLPWSRIDRVAYQYHYYTALPFLFVLLAYFLAELWHGASARTWTLARVAAAVALLLPGILWLAKAPLCAVAGVSGDVSPDICGASPASAALPAIGYLVAAGLVAWWLILGARDARRFVVFVFVAAAAFFGVYLSVLGAFPIPAGWAEGFQRLIPSWPVSFQFGSNTQAPAEVSILSLPAVGLTILVGALAVLTMIDVRRDQGRPIRWAVLGLRVPALRPPAQERPAKIDRTVDDTEPSPLELWSDLETPAVRPSLEPRTDDRARREPIPNPTVLGRLRRAYAALGTAMARPEDGRTPGQRDHGQRGR